MFRTVLLLSLLSAALPAFAHHGNSAYDQNRRVTLEGTVTEFLWANPHVQLFFDVADTSGNTVHWSCETVSPGILAREGWKRDELKPGEHITVTLNPAKSGAHVGYLLRIVTSDGKELRLGPGRDHPYSGGGPTPPNGP